MARTGGVVLHRMRCVGVDSWILMVLLVLLVLEPLHRSGLLTGPAWSSDRTHVCCPVAHRDRGQGQLERGGVAPVALPLIPAVVAAGGLFTVAKGAAVYSTGLQADSILSAALGRYPTEDPAFWRCTYIRVWPPSRRNYPERTHALHDDVQQWHETGTRLSVVKRVARVDWEWASVWGVWMASQQSGAWDRRALAMHARAAIGARGAGVTVTHADRKSVV